MSRRLLEHSLALAVAAALVAAVLGLGVLGRFAIVLGGLAALGAGAWAGGFDSRDVTQRWPFGPSACSRPGSEP